MDFVLVYGGAAFASLITTALTYEALRLASARRDLQASRLARRLYWKG